MSECEAVCLMECGTAGWASGESTESMQTVLVILIRRIQFAEGKFRHRTRTDPLLLTTWGMMREVHS